MKLFLAKLHYEKNPNFLKRLLRGVLSFCSIPYGAVTSVRNFLYDKNIIKSYDSGVLTISVGNLTTGGVGKTPFTAELANMFIRQGKKVAVLSRGYGGTLPNKEVNVISDGKKVLFNAQEAGDEPFWLGTNCNGVIVLTCSSRSKAAEKAVKDFHCDVLIADDALQHRKLSRNVNLLLVDQANKFGNERLLPAGPLRENFNGIKRATAIVVTNKTSNIENALKYCDEVKNKFNKPVFLCKMQPDNTYNIKSKEILYKGASVLAFCAIGQPNEFFDFVKEKFYLTATMTFPDHHAYDNQDIEMILKTAEENGILSVVTTEKDAVKIKSFVESFKTQVNFYALKLTACADFEDIVNCR